MQWRDRRFLTKNHAVRRVCQRDRLVALLALGAEQAHARAWALLHARAGAQAALGLEVLNVVVGTVGTLLFPLPESCELIDLCFTSCRRFDFDQGQRDRSRSRLSGARKLVIFVIIVGSGERQPSLSGNARNVLLGLGQRFEGIAFMFDRLDALLSLLQLNAVLFQLLLETNEIVPGLEGFLLSLKAQLLLTLEGLFCGLLGNAGRLELFLQRDNGALALEGLFAGAPDLFFPEYLGVCMSFFCATVVFLERTNA